MIRRSPTVRPRKPWRIAFAGAVSGTKNLMAIAICRDPDDLYPYINERLGQIPEILGYEVNIRTQRLKQHGSLVAHGRLINPRPPTRRVDA